VRPSPVQSAEAVALFLVPESVDLTTRAPILRQGVSANGVAGIAHLNADGLGAQPEQRVRVGDSLELARGNFDGSIEGLRVTGESGIEYQVLRGLEDHLERLHITRR
jgi:hypothetical protein